MSVDIFKRWLDMLWSFCNRKGWLFWIDSVHCWIFICCHDLAKVPFCDWGQSEEKHECQLSLTNYTKVNDQFYTLRLWQIIKSLKRGSISPTATKWRKKTNLFVDLAKNIKCVIAWPNQGKTQSMKFQLSNTTLQRECKLTESLATHEIGDKKREIHKKWCKKSPLRLDRGPLVTAHCWGWMENWASTDKRSPVTCQQDAWKQTDSIRTVYKFQ